MRARLPAPVPQSAPGRAVSLKTATVKPSARRRADTSREPHDSESLNSRTSAARRERQHRRAVLDLRRHGPERGGARRRRCAAARPTTPDDLDRRRIARRRVAFSGTFAGSVERAAGHRRLGWRRSCCGVVAARSSVLGVAAPAAGADRRSALSRTSGGRGGACVQDCTGSARERTRVRPSRASSARRRAPDAISAPANAPSSIPCSSWRVMSPCSIQSRIAASRNASQPKTAARVAGRSPSGPRPERIRPAVSSGPGPSSRAPRARRRSRASSRRPAGAPAPTRRNASSVVASCSAGGSVGSG